MLRSREGWLVGVAPVLGTVAIVEEGDRSLPPQSPRVDVAGHSDVQCRGC